MQDLLRVAIETAVFLLMLVVGLDCTGIGFRQCAGQLRLILAATLVQFGCIPVVALGTVTLLDLEPGLAAGLLLVSACPSGSISNTYTFLARGNTTLSITLTTFSCLAAFVATPALLFLLDALTGEALGSGFHLPWLPLAKQLLVSMALPVILGFLFRRRFPVLSARLLPAGRLISGVLVLSLVALITATNPGEIGRQLQQAWVPVIIFTSGLFLLAAAIATGFPMPWEDRKAVIFELPCRNLAIAALIGLSVLQRTELVYFATAFFLVEAVVLLLIAAAFALAKTEQQATL